MKNTILLFCSVLLFIASSCKQENTSPSESATADTGLKIAYVNGDSILMNFDEFRKESEAMEAKQKKAEEELQRKGQTLEREIMAYQQKAQSGTMTGKEMEAREKYLSSRQDAILAERDQMAKEIMDETELINKRLKEVLDEKLKAIKEQEGYDFILSYISGGQILLADEKYDITDRVLKELNSQGEIKVASDTTAKK